MNSDFCILGKVGSPYGVYGWAHIFSSTETPENLFIYKPLYLGNKDKWTEVEILEWRAFNDHFIVKFKGIQNREEIHKLTNFFISTIKTSLRKLSNGNYYWHELIGCSVFNQDGYNMGKIINLLETGSNDVLIVRACKTDAFNKKERLIPYINTYIVNIDITTKTIIVDWDADF